MATIKDIARLSGYSIGTVSRVMNNHPDVSARTREKILRIIKEQNFQPNSNAKHLKQQSSTSVAIFIKGYGNMLFADLLEQVQAILRDSGEDASVIYLDEDTNEVSAALRVEEERRPKGMIFLGGDLRHFREGFSGISTPAVLLTNTAAELGFDRLSSFTTDDSEGAAAAVRALIRAGHRRIGILGGDPPNSQISLKRVEGSVRELARSGISFDRERQFEGCRFSMEDGYAGAVRLLKRCPDLTAVFAIGDTIALGAMRAARDLGRRVPEEISFAGFDGIESVKYSIPRLATVHQDTAELARRGVEDLLLRISYAHPPVHAVIPFQLIQGESIMPAQTRTGFMDRK